MSEHQQKQDCRTSFQKGKIPSQLASLLRGQTLTRMIGKMYQSRSAKLSWPANQPGLYLFGDTRPKKSCWTQPYFCRRLVDPGGLKCVSLTTNLYKWLHTGEWVWEGSQSTYMGWFLRVKSAKALWQCLEALDNGPPLCLDTSLWKLLLLPFDFLTCSHVFHILRAKILETFQFQTVAQPWARPQEWQQTSFTTMWTKICYKTYLSHLGRSNTCSTASTSLSSFTSLALT